MYVYEDDIAVGLGNFGNVGASIMGLPRADRICTPKPMRQYNNLHPAKLALKRHTFTTRPAKDSLVFGGKKKGKTKAGFSRQHFFKRDFVRLLFLQVLSGLEISQPISGSRSQAVWHALLHDSCRITCFKAGAESLWKP